MAGPLTLRAIFAAYLGILVLMPAACLVWRGLSEGPAEIWAAIRAPIAVAALWLSVWTSLLTAAIQAVMGTAIAWVLVRFEIPGRALLAALVDLPVAIPTLVAGILIVSLYGPQSALGSRLVAAGVPVAFAEPGIVLSLVFVTLPFVVRAVEPVLSELDPAEEEAASTLGASRWTVFVKILLPPLLPAILSGAVATFARSLAEFGSIAVVSGNIPYKTLTAPVHVLGLVEAGDPGAASSVSLLLLAIALLLQPLAALLASRAGGKRG